jgi:hypothetical protein
MKTNKHILEQISKGNPFKVPENYFVNFNEEIMNRLPEKVNVVPSPQTVPLWNRIKPLVYAAAMFLGLFFTIRFINTKTNLSQDKSMASEAIIAPQANHYWSKANVTEDEFYRYLEDQLVEDKYYDYLYDELYSTSTNM